MHWDKIIDFIRVDFTRVYFYDILKWFYKFLPIFLLYILNTKITLHIHYLELKHRPVHKTMVL